MNRERTFEFFELNDSLMVVVICIILLAIVVVLEALTYLLSLAR